MTGKDRRLRLHRETVRELTDEGLGAIAGGLTGDETYYCPTNPPVSCVTCNADAACQLTYQPRCF